MFFVARLFRAPRNSENGERSVRTTLTTFTHFSLLLQQLQHGLPNFSDIYWRTKFSSFKEASPPFLYTIMYEGNGPFRTFGHANRTYAVVIKSHVIVTQGKILIKGIITFHFKPFRGHRFTIIITGIFFCRCGRWNEPFSSETRDPRRKSRSFRRQCTLRSQSPSWECRWGRIRRDSIPTNCATAVLRCPGRCSSAPAKKSDDLTRSSSLGTGDLISVATFFCFGKLVI